MFEVWQSDECKYDCKVKAFNTWEEASNFIALVQKYDAGWYWYIKEMNHTDEL